MLLFLQPFNSFCLPKNLLLPKDPYMCVLTRAFPLQTNPKYPPFKFQTFGSSSAIGFSNSAIFCNNSAIWGTAHVPFCLRSEDSDGFSSTQLSKTPPGDRFQEQKELELLNKPSPLPDNDGSTSEVDKESKYSNKDEALKPFLKFFKGSDSEEVLEEGEELEASEEKDYLGDKEEEGKRVSIEYYEPKPGDLVVGVVVSGNENRLDINVGANSLGSMLTKEVLPLYGKEMEYLLCDMNRDAENFMSKGKMGIVKNEDALIGGPVPGRPIVEIGTILFAEVLGRTLSGRPLLSTRRYFRRIAWHRLRQIKQLNEPIEVRITEWNTGGLLTRIEGLRAFLPKAELLKRVTSFTELKENVGRQIYVQIMRIDESKNDLILSEREAWEKLYLQEGTLLDGTVRKVFPYGAQIKLGESNRIGLLHISNISRAKVSSVSDLFAVDEKIKVMVVKSMFPGKISLSIADLENKPGMFLSDKEKVYSEAEEMAKKYREKLSPGLSSRRGEPLPNSDLPFDNEGSMYANWKWFKFERGE